VRAPWHEPAGSGVEIVIDPGQAFGTGAHPTTRLCLELLLDVTGQPSTGTPDQVVGIRGVFRTADPPPARGLGAAPSGGGGLGPLADLGCGSGVLSIAAAKLGFAPVLAVDNERAAVEATIANASANGVILERVDRQDLRAGPAPVAAVTVANLVRPLLLAVAERWRTEEVEQPETLIVSGLLEGEEDEVAAAFAPLRERRRLRLQGWSALLLTRP
jgi:ribosomal protein L11 methyltransferase